MYKIIHLSDTHIRNLKFHGNYRVVFEDLYQKVREAYAQQMCETCYVSPKIMNPDVTTRCGYVVVPI